MTPLGSGKSSWVGSQKTLAGFLSGVRGFGLFLDRAFVWCVLGFGCYVWLYGVLCHAACGRHC